ncbi:alpha-galactosidase [Dyadobacter sp. BE34]|uniref:Alpha-galactosidase n=1 Tax=Dyadobacter fermentans TaxID=94254 RepID=A0ABU1QSP8_9BACT|nr:MULTISPECIES: alpha-galactosidase [Dyadobacter]MDR6804184.1 alpha-galactosidase [Dyadobacter fermentans]MDR7041924.1 alpha-galactosidase [Dyadobacter sp. BE242]MDR7196327.1 alpha-galactosidase [Dyadobacter sp. BE34]MDR7213128.1 alpha-galactosidase [Dyadobacter sp. BE31]MDR7261733.1 alpha-galactosidase [Dyadobacter sp. BE32]
MYYKFIKVALLAIFASCNAFSQDSLVIKNRFLERKFTIGDNSFYTSRFQHLLTNKDYSRPGSEEFYFTINGTPASANGTHGLFKYIKHTSAKTHDGIQKVAVQLAGKPGTSAENVIVDLTYELYDELPVVRKQISVTNNGTKAIAIADLEVERLNLVPVSSQQSELYTNYGSRFAWRPYHGDHHDAAIFVHNNYAKEGFILGNEAPSILKKTEVYTDHHRISIGMTSLADHYPFKKWIEPQEKFDSPKTFICLIKSDKWEDAFEGHFADFIRTRLGVKLFERKEIPFTFYNTWRPFYTNINDTLVTQLADGLEGTGTDLFIMDAGWESNYGDWEAHPSRFPNGLKPITDHIRKRGMKAGLWMSLGSVDKSSKLYKEHPEWSVYDQNGEPAYLHEEMKNRVTMSLASGYYDYILEKIKRHVRENDLAYIKLDLAIANSAYVLDYSKKGDYKSDGKGYKDRESSYYAIYEKALQLFDDLHKSFPDLLVDCTYEVWGEYYINDYALIEHADYDWLTNYDDDAPVGPINIRQMAFDRSRAIPTATNLIGNQFIDSPYSKYTFLSLASVKPILVGDSRKLPAELKPWYLKWNTWFKMMDKKYQFTRFSYVSDIFQRPTMSNWDGVYKFNKEKQGGVLFFFRNGSVETTRTFAFPLAEPDSRYRLFSAEDSKDFGVFSGKELNDKGIEIRIDKQFDAEVLGIEKVN